MTEKKKVIPAKLPREVYQGLEDIVGREYITEDRAVVETYSKFSIDCPGYLKKYARDPSNIPACVVLPETTEEVQAICRLASRYNIKINPFTNGQFLLAAQTTPDPTICIHVSRMNWVDIDEDNMSARLGAYADYGQLQAEAMKKGLWNGGTPLATTLCKLSSQSAFVGVWQTDHKYGTLSRNIISIKVVTPTGEILETGSKTTAGVEDFWEFGPGPDLLSLIRGCAGTSGVITEITVKLHPWPGDKDMPEPEAGRPSIPTYDNASYDTPPFPSRHKLLWVEFPDMATELKALREIAYSGIGIGLNATGVYNAYYCSPTQKITLERVKNKFFPPYNCYLIIQGMVSETQIEYEEMVMREIIKEVGGTFLSKDYKPEVLEALAPWNIDCIRHATGFRMNRFNYAGSVVPGGGLEDIAYKTQKIWGKALDTFGGETYITDRGGIDDTPFLYSINKGGRFWLAEVDIYPDPMDPSAIERGNGMVMSAMINLFADKIGLAPTGIGISFEPITSFFPEMGPRI
ncbi:MAG: FAD-binding oxidoreductase [Deltaproteobacteria bacterium]|nr:FAD-binding oxidoreductase [Deltaproteobacteria bacterium]